MQIAITIGPTSWSSEMLDAIIGLGVRMVRFPFAKELPEDHLRREGLLKQLALKRNKDVITIADLPGGKPRLGNLTPHHVSCSRQYRISLRDDDASLADFFLSPSLATTDFAIGSVAIIGDGENSFRVDGLKEDIVTGQFEKDGTLERRRAFVPRTALLTINSFTDADKTYLRAIGKSSFDWVALSFVDSPDDILRAREWIGRELGWTPKLVAKIETLQGIVQAGPIVEVADAIMIGRGDLGVHIGYERLWQAQDRVLRCCRTRNRYSIVATGFAESLIAGEHPTRQECIDVCTAMEQGADAILLASETTIGAHPLNAIQAMQRIVASNRLPFD